MQVVTNTERIIKTISYTEAQILRDLSKALPDGKGEIVFSKLTAHRSKAATLLNKLAAAGVLDTWSMGMRGTFVKIINREAFDEIIREVT